MSDDTSEKQNLVQQDDYGSFEEGTAKVQDEVREEDEWLYGENVAEDQIKIDPEQAEKLLESNDTDEDEESRKQEGQPDDEALRGSGEEDDDDDEDSDDDGVQVVIGDLKSQTPGAFGSAKRAAGPPPDKKGKFSVEDFESPGTINGVPAIEFSIDTLEEKPWRKPGADITDYFNYGFTEETWRAYCDRQKRMRFEAGGMLNNPMAKQMQGTPGVIISDGQKFGVQSNIIFPKKFGQQQQFPRKDGQPMMILKQEPKENNIQVRVINTIERRDIARKGYDMPPATMMPPPFDMSVPPPVFRHPPGFMGPPHPDFFNRPPPSYYQEEEMHNYENQSTQWMDSQWEMEGSGIGPSSSVSVIPLTKAPLVPPPPPGEGDEQDSANTNKQDSK